VQERRYPHADAPCRDLTLVFPAFQRASSQK
jgi:hypothetical protein